MTVAYKGVNLVVTIQGGSAWLKVWVDGVLDPRFTQAGKTLRSGNTMVFTGETSVEVRTGSSGVTHFTLNGVAPGCAREAAASPRPGCSSRPRRRQLTQRR